MMIGGSLVVVIWAYVVGALTGVVLVVADGAMVKSVNR